MLCNGFAGQNLGQQNLGQKPQLSQSPPAIFLYSGPLKFSVLSFVDITGSKGESHFTREGLRMGGEVCGGPRAGAACRGRAWACLAFLWIPSSAWPEQAVPLWDNAEHEFPCCLDYFWNANLHGLIHVLVLGEKLRPATQPWALFSCFAPVGFTLPTLTRFL